MKSKKMMPVAGFRSKNVKTCGARCRKSTHRSEPLNYQVTANGLKMLAAEGYRFGLWSKAFSVKAPGIEQTIIVLPGVATVNNLLSCSRSIHGGKGQEAHDRKGAP